MAFYKITSAAVTLLLIVIGLANSQSLQVSFFSGLPLTWSDHLNRRDIEMNVRVSGNISR